MHRLFGKYLFKELCWFCKYSGDACAYCIPTGHPNLRTTSRRTGNSIGAQLHETRRKCQNPREHENDNAWNQLHEPRNKLQFWLCCWWKTWNIFLKTERKKGMILYLKKKSSISLSNYFNPHCFHFISLIISEPFFNVYWAFAILQKQFGKCFP